MKLLLKLLAFLAVTVVICFLAAGVWLYFYTADLPPVSQLRDFAPASVTSVRMHHCDGSETTISALPYDELGRYLLPALEVSEGEPAPHGPYPTLIGDLLHQPARRRYGAYSAWLAQSVACGVRLPSPRALSELRIANAIERRFGTAQVLTIYLNRVYLGADTYGVEAGATRYFQKHAWDLSLNQAALLAALIRSPRHLLAHPEHALELRNSILDGMAKKGVISAKDASAAKGTELSISQAR